MKAKFGVRLPVSGPLASPADITRIGVKADELGFDAITTHDHVSTSFDKRYHNAGGTAELVDERVKKGLSVTDFYETVATLSVLAGKTSRVRLIPCSMVLPWRHPILLAKQAITLHELSGGRFVLCVCIGNFESDFKAMGVDYSRKGKIIMEYLNVLKMILTSPKGEASYEGKFINVPPSELLPRPSTKLPLWIAGFFNERAFERVARYGDGFLPAVSPDVFRKEMPRLRQFMQAKRRSIEELEVGTQTFMCVQRDGEEAKRKSRHTIESFFKGHEFEMPDPSNPGKTMKETLAEGSLRAAFVGSPTQVANRIEEYLKEGCTFFDIRQINDSTESVVEMMTLFAKEVMPSFN
jgi:alkanesulfonate monooxygenase SsuD/methylene tetrahydromethanopterin reductase-like flavin-dependent oxidoreductase (luciferase family)